MNAYAQGAAASPSAWKIDGVFLFIAAVSLFFFFLVEGMLIYFAIRYRRRKGAEEGATPDIRGNFFLEVVWVLVPSLAVLAFFIYGYVVYRDVTAPQPGASDINVVAEQFLYKFKYPDGRTTMNELRIPAGRPVQLIMTSKDVIHGFFIPDYRIKQDILPGRYTYLHLRPDREGTFDIYCTQYCGVGHSTMRAKLVVMQPDAYAAWMSKVEGDKGTLSFLEKGKALLEKFGCLGCHSIDGTVKVGPSLKGLYGREEHLEGGGEVIADEEYFRESLFDPGAKVARGFPNIMPTYKGSITDDDIAAIITYIKTLK